MYEMTSARQSNRPLEERSFILSILKDLIAAFQTIAQPEDSQRFRSNSKPPHAQESDDVVSVIFASNEFLTVHLLTDVYNAEG